MKKILIGIFLLGFSLSAQSQVMQQKAQWATVMVPQLKCWTCKEKMEKFLLTEKGPGGDAGIIKWTIAINTGTLKIQYVPDRITLDYIRVAINNAGFDADSTQAEPDAYKMLPPLCKRASDGGGPQTIAPQESEHRADRFGTSALWKCVMAFPSGYTPPWSDPGDQRTGAQPDRVTK